jgi:hypothetical protein
VFVVITFAARAWLAPRHIAAADAAATSIETFVFIGVSNKRLSAKVSLAALRRKPGPLFGGQDESNVG